jgi:metacaspase-1
MARLALCIGINNYPGTHMDLAGCVNDANEWAAELTTRGFTVTRLLDQAATKAAMVSAFTTVIGQATKGDLVVITFSGHGTYVPDQNGDEADGLDEGLCPHDIQTGGGALVDDEIQSLFAARKAGVRLVLVADSCHSGTVTRAVADDDAPSDMPRARFLPMGNWMPASQLPRGASGKPLATVAVSSGASPFAAAMSKGASDLLLAGCREGANNFSYDARIQGRPIGAFTHFALRTLRTLPAGATYADWHAAITPKFLPSVSYPQVPQIVGSAAARNARVLE